MLFLFFFNDFFLSVKESHEAATVQERNHPSAVRSSGDSSSGDSSTGAKPIASGSGLQVQTSLFRSSCSSVRR